MSMSTLYFDDDSGSETEDEGQSTEFPTYVSRVFRQRDSTLDVRRVHLTWVRSFNRDGAGCMDKWMRYLTDHNIQSLYIKLSVYNASEYQLPSCIFTCASLNRLSLTIWGNYMTAPDIVQLRGLQKLSFERFSASHISLQTLFRGCPVLTDVFFSICKLEDPDIASDSLRKLHIEGCEIVGTRMRISAPSLQDLLILHNEIQKLKVQLENLSSLISASIITADYERRGFEGSCLDFVSPTSEAMLGKKLPELEIFHNLKTLCLDGWSMQLNFPAVKYFLERSPNLKWLELERYSLGDSPGCSPLRKSFVCSHIKMRMIVDCGTENYEVLELVTKFFNSKCGCFQGTSSGDDAGSTDDDGAGDGGADIADDNTD